MIEVEVKAGGQVIGKLDITRVDGLGRIDSDSINGYVAHLRWQMGRPESDKEVYIKHRYGDHWPLLIETALKHLIDKTEMRR